MLSSNSSCTSSEWSKCCPWIVALDSICGKHVYKYVLLMFTKLALGLFVFYDSFLLTTAGLRGCTYYCQHLSGLAISPVHTFNIQPLLISTGLPKNKLTLPSNSIYPWMVAAQKQTEKKKNNPRHLIEEMQHTGILMAIKCLFTLLPWWQLKHFVEMSKGLQF